MKMKHSRSRALALTAVFLMIAMATMGVGYGLWSKILTVNGTVNTGNIGAAFSSVLCFDHSHTFSSDLTPTDPFGPHPHGALMDVPELKDVSSTTAAINANPMIIDITVNNAYPSNANDCEVEWTNFGSVPVFVELITINGTSTDANNNDLELELDGDPGDGPELWIQWINGLCTQVDPGQTLAGSLKWHTEQGATEGATYQWQMEITLVQWNETTNCT